MGFVQVGLGLTAGSQAARGFDGPLLQAEQGGTATVTPQPLACSRAVVDLSVLVCS